MSTAKREAQSLPMTEQKRRRESVPSVKKVNFMHNSNSALTADHPKNNETQKKSGLKVRRSRKSRHRTSYNSCSESEGGVDEKSSRLSKIDVTNNREELQDGKRLNAVNAQEQKNCCSTPVSRRGNDVKDCGAHVSQNVHEREQSFGRHAINSPFGTGIKSMVNNSSFYDDDVALAALNLSEIITSSGVASTAVEGDNGASLLTNESNQFYGLPLKVKELLHRFKGIETLYGKIW